MLMFGPARPKWPPHLKKSEIRPWVDLANEAQHGGTHKVSLERPDEKSAVDHPDPVWCFHIDIYKQVRPSAALALLRAQCYYHVEMCVTMDCKKLLTRHCIAMCKARKFPPRPPATRHCHGC